MVYTSARQLAAFLIASLVGGATATILNSQTAVPAVLRAERFELVDRNGAVRAHLETDPRTGITNLSLFDGNRKPRAWLSASNQPALILWDAAGTPRAQLSLNDEGAAVLEMRDSISASPRPGALRVVLGTGSRTLPGGSTELFPPSSLLVFDGGEKVVSRIP